MTKSGCIWGCDSTVVGPREDSLEINPLSYALRVRSGTSVYIKQSCVNKANMLTSL